MTGIGLARLPATGGEIGQRDGCKYGAAAGDAGSFTTPTTADSTLMLATLCPPAPWKSAPALLPDAARPDHRLRRRAAVPAACQEDAGARGGVIRASRHVRRTPSLCLVHAVQHFTCMLLLRAIVATGSGRRNSSEQRKRAGPYTSKGCRATSARRQEDVVVESLNSTPLPEMWVTHSQTHTERTVALKFS